MAKPREDLQFLLEKVLGSRNVYFQPPQSIEMKYPAIVYSRSNMQSDFANNSIYKQLIAYSVTIIDEDPDSEIISKVSEIPLCRFDRHYTSDNLNHDIFTLYF